MPLSEAKRAPGKLTNCLRTRIYHTVPNFGARIPRAWTPLELSLPTITYVFYSPALGRTTSKRKALCVVGCHYLMQAAFIILYRIPVQLCTRLLEQPQITKQINHRHLPVGNIRRSTHSQL